MPVEVRGYGDPVSALLGVRGSVHSPQGLLLQLVSLTGTCSISGIPADSPHPLQGACIFGCGVKDELWQWCSLKITIFPFVTILTVLGPSASAEFVGLLVMLSSPPKAEP